MTERSYLWAPISPPAPPPRVTVAPPRVTVEPLVASYRSGEPVRINRSQRYGLVLVEPLPEPVWRQA